MCAGVCAGSGGLLWDMGLAVPEHIKCKDQDFVESVNRYLLLKQNLIEKPLGLINAF